MARIRTIKPEFWTDEKIVRLPFESRLLFIGLWNFCDDEGYMAYEPDRIRMQVLPSDDIDIDVLLDHLVAMELVELLVDEADDFKEVLRINNFNAHQKISNPSQSKFSGKEYKKKAVPCSVRREVAVKYECKPGGEKVVQCYCCGAAGKIHWHKQPRERGAGWVSFSDVELSHFVPELDGGSEAATNIVLCCRSCNRSMGYRNNPVSQALKRFPESSRVLGLEGNGKEKEKEGNEKETSAAVAAPSLPDRLDVPEFRDAWQRWVKHRIEIKKPLKPTMVTEQIDRFAQWGPERAIAAIKHTIGQGWQGIREPDAKPPPSGPARQQMSIPKLAGGT